MAFTAKDVQALREMTGVGMMDCKKALTASDGDMDKAVEFLREKGLAASAKKAGRVAAEGMAYAAVIDGVGVVVEVNAETDFVGKNEKFVDFVKGVAATVAANKPADLEALMACKYNGTDLTVEQQQQEMVLVIGENIKVRRFAIFTEGVSVPYIHAGGKIGVLVNLEVSAGLEDKVTEVGKDMAMQIAALNPRFLDKSQVDQATLDEEKKILLVQMENDPKMASKPEAVRDFYTNDQLLAITHELTDALRKNKTIDWNLKESARAGMRRLVKRLLKKYKYPPEGQEDALNTIMEQCEMWSENS